MFTLHCSCTCTSWRGCSTRPLAMKHTVFQYLMACTANKCMSIFVLLPLLLIIKVLQILHLALVDKRAHTHIFLPAAAQVSHENKLTVCRPVWRWSASPHFCRRVCSLWGSWSALSVCSHLTSNTLSCFSLHGGRWRTGCSWPQCTLLQLCTVQLKPADNIWSCKKVASAKKK